MNRTLLLLVGLGAVVGGTMIWARWWVNSVEPATTATTVVRTELAPELPKRPVDPPRVPAAIRSAEPKTAASATDRRDGGATVTQVLPLREPAPLLTPAPPPPLAPPEASSAEAATEPPEFRHLRRLRDPSHLRSRVPPANNPRIQLEPLIQR